jgi:hypothetical protein
MSDRFHVFPRWLAAFALIASFGLALSASPVSAQNGDLTNDTTSDASDDIPPDGDDLDDLTNDTGDDGDDLADLTADTGDDGDDVADLTNDTGDDGDDVADLTNDTADDAGDDDTGDAADGTDATDDGAADDGDDATDDDSVNELPDTGVAPARDSGIAELLILASVALAVIGTYTWMKRSEHTL